MDQVSFSTTNIDRQLINRLARRAVAIDAEQNGDAARKIMDWQMDFTACHANGCPLDLERLSKADNFNFAHDAFGIARHLNRETGKLENFFRPRFASKD